MRDAETILADMAVKNEAYDTLIKVYDLFKDEKIDEAKALINSTVKSNNNKQNPSNILHRILKMVYEFSDIVSNDDIFRKVSDIVYYLQVIQVWFACKYVILYEKNKAEEDLK